MALFVRVFGMLGAFLLRAALLLALLFAGHLLISRALPQLRATAEAIEREPAVRARLSALSEQLDTELEGAGQLSQRLDQLSARRLRDLEARWESYKHRLQELGDERARLSEQLRLLREERDEYCSSYNPLKRWMCHELEERFAALSERLEPLLDRLEEDVQSARQAADATSKQLLVLRDPDLSAEEKLRRLGDDRASTVTLQLAASQQRIERAQAGAKELRAELARIEQLKASRSGWLLREWNQVRFRLLWLVALVLFIPYVQRVLNYFVLMPLLKKIARPLRLSEGADAASLHVSEAQRSLVMDLGEGETARVRAEYARPVQGKATSQLLYQWRAPLVSYAAGLNLLTRVDGDAQGVSVTLAAPEDPNSYLMRVDMREHPGLVVHPKHIVGVVGELELATRWRPFSLVAWSTWQLRYIVFRGTGSVILEGHGDTIATQPGLRPTKLEQKLIMAFDTRLTYATDRTETFLPYLVGKTTLVDDLFEGDAYVFWQKSTRAGHRSPVARSFDFLFSALGKLLGF